MTYDRTDAAVNRAIDLIANSRKAAAYIKKQIGNRSLQDIPNNELISIVVAAQAIADKDR